MDAETGICRDIYTVTKYVVEIRLSVGILALLTGWDLDFIIGKFQTPGIWEHTISHGVGAFKFQEIFTNISNLSWDRYRRGVGFCIMM